MMVDERETTNGHVCDLNCSMVPAGNDNGGLFVDASGGGDGEGIRIYKRRKRIKMSNSDENTKTEFNDKIKGVGRLSFDGFLNGPGDCSLRQCRKIVLQQMYKSLKGREDGIGECIRNAVKYPENGCTSGVKECVDKVERSENKTHSSNNSESSTVSELCGHGLFEVLTSDKFSELCGLLIKNIGVVNVSRILDVNAINMKMKSGSYETSPMLFLKDIQQLWTKLQQAGNELVTLATSLSDISRAHYEQFVRKPRETEACGASNCKGCGEKADVGNCLICDSCEHIFHISCSDLVGTEIPPKSWYCASCNSNGIGSPHNNCIVCEKLKSAAPITTLIPANNSESQNMLQTIIHEGSKTCFICKSEVNKDDNFRTCGHSLCPHKFYHYRCLSSKELGVCGPCWYCPSCLCRGCLIDKDDDQTVLCDGCDQAYHIYCTYPRLKCIPKGSWFCGKCDRELKRIKMMKMVYENMQKKVKVEHEDEDEDVVSGGLDMLVTAAKTLSHRESMDIIRNT